MTDPEREKDREKDRGPRGYGNIYTPHAGAMIIHVQRESGLANRMIILSARRVRFLRIGGIVAAVVLVLGVLSWFYLARQAARVPDLSKQVTALQRDVQQLDTLKRALAEVEGRFQQVQKMMGASTAAAPALAASIAAGDSAGLPNQWPLPIAGQLIEVPGGGARPTGIDVAVPKGTPVRAAGNGLIVEIRDDSALGRVVRMQHRHGYESLYGNLLDVRVSRGQRITAGTIIASSGDSSGAFPAHLHFEIVRDGTQLNPAAFVTKGPLHGDLQ